MGPRFLPADLALFVNRTRGVASFFQDGFNLQYSTSVFPPVPGNDMLWYIYLIRKHIYFGGEQGGWGFFSCFPLWADGAIVPITL